MSRELRTSSGSFRSRLEFRNEAGEHLVNLISLGCERLKIVGVEVAEVSREDQVIREFTGRATCELQISCKVDAAIHAATFSDIRADGRAASTYLRGQPKSLVRWKTFR